MRDSARLQRFYDLAPDFYGIEFIIVFPQNFATRSHQDCIGKGTLPFFANGIGDRIECTIFDLVVIGRAIFFFHRRLARFGCGDIL